MKSMNERQVCYGYKFLQGVSMSLEDPYMVSKIRKKNGPCKSP